MDKSKEFPNPATSATLEGILVLYDSAFQKNYALDRVLIHELAHQHFQDLSAERKEAYRNAAGWYRIGKVLISRPFGYVAEDGKLSLEEDYANNIEYYLYESDKLNQEVPKVFEWIKGSLGKKFSLKKGKK